MAVQTAEVRNVLSAARKLLHEILSGATETLDESAKVIGYSFGPGYSGLVCTLIISRIGVKIGIVHGSELPDPKGLLEGSGKVHRYVAVRTLADLERLGLRAILKAMAAAWKKRNKGNQ